MILPTKHLKTEASLIYVGGVIQSKVSDVPLTIDQLWHSVKQEYQKRILDYEITYDWFILALSLLFTIGIVLLADGRIVGDAND